MILPLLMWAWSACALLAQSTLQVIWENSDSELLLDSSGTTLSVGSSGNGDGCVLQLGYYSNATALNPFNGDFVALTGEGSPNTQFQTTALGDSNGQSAGRFSLSSTFQAGSSTSGLNLPAPGTPLVIRYFNSSTIPTSTYYNAVSAGTTWAWKAPSATPGELLLLSLGDSGLSWLGGASSAQRTSLPSAIRFDTQPGSVTLNPDGSATLSVAVSGLLPATFQWRKNGANISGATSASYSLVAAQVGDSGTYDVMVTNLAGSKTSSAAAVSVNAPVNITAQPASLTVNPGSLATFAVTATGTAPLTYQWRKDGVPIAGGSSVTYSLTAQAASAGNYDVLVTNLVNSATSNAAVLSVNAPVNITPSLSSQPGAFRMIKGAATTLALSVQATVAGAVDTWRLLAVGQDIQLLSGTVASGGQFSVPLRSITTPGDYIIRLSRAYSDDSQTTTTDSLPFHIDVQTWDTIAASYEALLLDSNHVLADGAVYRGILNFSITRFGYMSGRLRFNEPLPISNAPDSALRNYTPVIRTFSSGFTPVEGNPSLMQTTPRLGTGTAAGREELVLQLDLNTTPPTFSATIKHSAAVIYGDTTVASTSVAANCPRLVTNLTTLPSTLSGAPGHYLLAADFPSDQAHMLLQVSSTGRLLWVTRRPGYTGTGSTALCVEGASTFAANIYEAQTTVVRLTSSQLVRSWLGKVNFHKSDLGSWGAAIDSNELPKGLELQSCNLTSANGLISYKLENSNWARIQKVNFSAEKGCLWSLQSDSSSFLRTPSKFTLNLLNPPRNPDTQPGESLWNVTISTAGVAFCERAILNGVTPGLMLMRVDRLNGALLGTYIPTEENLRYRVYGVTLDPVDSPSIRAAGWVEYGTAPFISSGSWTLQNGH